MREVRLDDIREPGPVDSGRLRRPGWGSVSAWIGALVALSFFVAGYDAVGWGIVVVGILVIAGVEFARWRRRS